MAQDELTATPPPIAYVAQAEAVVQVDETAYGDFSACQVVQALVVEQVEVVLGAPVVVTVEHVVKGTTAGVVHVELVPHETLMALLKLAQTGVGVVFPVEQVELTATPPPRA